MILRLDTIRTDMPDPEPTHRQAERNQCLEISHEQDYPNLDAARLAAIAVLSILNYVYGTGTHHIVIVNPKTPLHVLSVVNFVPFLENG